VEDVEHLVVGSNDLVGGVDLPRSDASVIAATATARG
jgi:hypothetical protein